MDLYESRRAEELRAVRDLDGDPWLGEDWYLISTGWLLAWLKFASGHGGAGAMAPLPGPIDNTVLLLSASCTREPLPGLVRVQDCRGVNRRVWDMLVLFYGGGPAIPRPVVDI